MLCLTQSQERADALQRRWREEHNEIQFSCTTLDDYVSHLYERATGNLANSTLSRVQRFRLVEAAIEQYGESVRDGPFAGIESPANDLIDQVQGLFSLLEYAGYDTPDAIEHALQAAGAAGSDSVDAAELYGSFRETDPSIADSTLTEQATAFAGLYAEYKRLRSELHPDWQSVVTEQYLTLLDNDQLLTTVSDSVDAVILDGLTRLAPAERETVARLSRAYPTVATLALTHDSWDGLGVDSGVERALDVYQTLDFDLEYQTSSRANENRVAAVRSLYDHTEETPSYRDRDVEVTFTEPPTERDEVRATARRIRSLLDDGVDPADIGVVVTDRATYRGILSEVFLTYDIPFTFVNQIGIEQTLVGGAVQALLDLTDEETQTSSLLDLAANRLVTLDAFSIDPDALSTAAAKAPDQTLDRLLEILERNDHTATAEGVRELLTTITPTDDGLAEFTSGLADALERLAVEDAVDAYAPSDEATGSHRPAYEQSAWSAVERVLSSFDAVAPYLADQEPARRVRRALLAELVSGPRQQQEYVRVYPIAEAEMASFDHLFTLGLTMGYFPSESDTMAFFEAVNDADEEFGRAHSGRRARYILGTLLTGSDEVTLSIPQHTVEGTEHVPAPVISELERYVERTDTGAGEEALPHVVSEDIQQSYRSWAVRESFESPERAAEPLTSADGLSADSRAFATQGVTCSWRRSRPGLTDHEAQIEDIVDTVFPEDRREPYSPSALDDYARCPFVFLMKRVLGYEEDYGDEAGITRADRGTYVHAVLAAFYRRLRPADDQPVDLTTFDRETLESTLLDVALDELADIGEVDTPFERRTIGRLLAGLGDPAQNPYHGFGGEEMAGLFARFLDTELDNQAGMATQPAYFEGAIDIDYDDVELLSDAPVTIDTPDGPVDIRGIADRIDRTARTPYQFHIRDYKTGSTPGRSDITGGTKLQLPLYGLAFETALEERTGDAHEAVAGSYYKLKSPDDIDPVAGELTSKDAVSDDSSPLVPPLSQAWRLPFDTQAEFSRFIRDVTPTRVGRIGTAIENGAFQPTLLSENLANCENCTFRHSCDVRHHHQRDTIEELDDSEHYISERARDEDLDLDAYTDGGGV
ncbi:PD-(D/E)XK nuclease family protein [Halorubrum ezzemoulense]|uniref:PD-(D/E)XK nuclease family protein n=1 Tax=Halorubrum ezzemoulense TaxID=337243 RepID=UPI00232F89BA|nr:PD-(D/E)XK nuclease family protein [Halorubrum ezzemoulense]MDB2283267.1 PD-(D/E)XK nuclease family protein [Halorubrum ezzemoulense]